MPDIQNTLDQHKWKLVWLKGKRTALALEISQHESCIRTLEAELEKRMRQPIVVTTNFAGRFGPGLAASRAKQNG